MGRATATCTFSGTSSVISIHALRGEGDDYVPQEFAKAFDFNPRPPWGGRQNQGAVDASVKEFQSTPSVGRATCIFLIGRKLSGFQSTPSVGRATLPQSTSAAHNRRHFNPRPPWGGRPCHKGSSQVWYQDFNPRPPWGGRQYVEDFAAMRDRISIHALRGEGDRVTVTPP